METQMFFSVIMPVFNGETYLEEAILSVVNQTFDAWELIIIDDGSKDNSLKLAENWAVKDPRIKVIFHPEHKNKGVSASRNLGMERAKGEWISFLDADDYWLPEKMSWEQEIIENHPNVVLLYGNAQYKADANSRKNLEIYGSGIPGISENPFLSTLSGFHSHLSNTSVLRSVITTNKLTFNEKLRFAEDTLFTHEVLQFGALYYLNIVTGTYRLHPTSSCAFIPKEEKIAGRYVVYENLLQKTTGENKKHVSEMLVKIGMMKIWKYFLRKPLRFRKIWWKYLLKTLKSKNIDKKHRLAALFAPFYIAVTFIFKSSQKV